MTLSEELAELITQARCATTEVYDRALARLAEGKLTKDENPASHYCTHFTPYDPSDKTVLIVDHKKAQTWLFPGGHIDKDENILKTLNREIGEELGISHFFSGPQVPFLITHKLIFSDKHRCREHFDFWYLMQTPKAAITVDMEEFHNSTWASYAEAKQTLTDTNNLLALERIIRSF